MTEASEVQIEIRADVVWITINRHERRNEINAAVLSGISDGLTRAQSDPAVRAIVLTGAGEQAFCAGAFGHDFARPQQHYADHAIFGLPEVKVGVFPMQVWSVLAPLLAARDLAGLCITGEPVEAATAERVRLVNHVVPAADLDAKVARLLRRITDKSPTAIRRGKYAMESVAGLTFDQAIVFTETMIGPTSMTRDAAEGVAAFSEKRKPEWTGQ